MPRITKNIVSRTSSSSFLNFFLFLMIIRLFDKLFLRLLFDSKAVDHSIFFVLVAIHYYNKGFSKGWDEIHIMVPAEFISSSSFCLVYAFSSTS